MKTVAKSRRLTVTIAVLVTVVLATAPVSAKEKQPTGQHDSSNAVAASFTRSMPQADHPPTTGEHDSKPGPARKAVGGTVKQIADNTYTVEDYEGNQVTLYVSQEPTQFRGEKKVGDKSAPKSQGVASRIPSGNPSH